MKHPERFLPALALLLFLPSFAMKSYAGGTGWDCLRHCAEMPFEEMTFSWGILYYFAFTLTNIMLPFLAARAWLGRPTRVWHLVVGALALGHVLSWSVVNLVEGGGGFGDIQHGYWVWASAYGLLVAQLILGKLRSRSDPDPGLRPLKPPLPEASAMGR